MSDIIDFLTARLNEDERGALTASVGPWHLNAEHDEVIAADDIEVCTVFALSSNQLRKTANHITRHDPARVLREIEAKRAIIAQREALTPKLTEYSLDPAKQHLISFVVTSALELEETLKHLASAYNDHPDYPETLTARKNDS